MLVPRNEDLKPAILFLPGGGFTSADYQKFFEMRTALAQAGFVVAAAEFRTRVPDKFPALVEDGKATVRYLLAHATEYGIDPDRIGVFSDSAGGYLVQMLGMTNGEKAFDKGDYLTTSSDVQAVASRSEQAALRDSQGPRRQGRLRSSGGRRGSRRSDLVSEAAHQSRGFLVPRYAWRSDQGRRQASRYRIKPLDDQRTARRFVDRHVSRRFSLPGGRS
ncbi:MAG: alpha/beta hydrolase, partial [Breoghania sp.]|nr:alpha/beta hydrolase [Breoghania sp.]